MFDHESRDLMAVISLLDGANITERLLERMTTRKLAWGSDGDIEVLDPAVLPALANMSKARFRYLQASVTAARKPTETSDWKFEALKVVLHTFPEHRQLDPV